VGFWSDKSGAGGGFEFDSLKNSWHSITYQRSTVVTAMNDSGLAVGYGSDSSGNVHCFLYNAATGQFTPIVPSGAIGSAIGMSVSGINGSGQVVGNWSDSAGVVHGFLYDTSTNAYWSYDYPNSTGETYFNSINNNGQVVGSYQGKNGFYGFLWDLNTGIPKPLPNLGSPEVNANSINDFAQVVGNYYSASGGGIYYMTSN